MECEECGREPEGAACGWRTYRAESPLEPPQLVTYCADCAWREFGPPRHRSEPWPQPAEPQDGGG